MKIRKANENDIGEIEAIYASARAFMASSGNPRQWKNGYPSRENILADMGEDCLYVMEEEARLLAVFYFRVGEDETYQKIYGGAWPSDEKYGVIHRVAVKAFGRGIAGEIFKYCFEVIPSLRIDTHRDNLPMQKSLEKFGFRYCGIIHLKNGEERLAFQKL